MRYDRLNSAVLYDTSFKKIKKLSKFIAVLISFSIFVQQYHNNATIYYSRMYYNCDIMIRCRYKERNYNRPILIFTDFWGCYWPCIGTNSTNKLSRRLNLICGANYSCNSRSSTTLPDKDPTRISVIQKVRSDIVRY